MRRLAVAGAVLLVASACGGSRTDQVFVGSASSFSHALETVAAAYDDYELEVLVGGSQLLVTQVLEEAPIDVVVTADWPTMEALVLEGKTLADPIRFARNSLAIAVEPGNPLSISSLRDLSRPDVKLVLADINVPLGRYTAQLLGEAGVDAQPVSLASSASGVAGLLASGEADVGIVYQSDIAVWDLTAVPIRPAANISTDYYIAIIAGSPNQDGAEALVDFLLSSEGQDLLVGVGLAS